MQSKARISKAAVASLVLGLIFFLPIVSTIAAIGFGIKARRSIHIAGDALLGKGLATSGITLGLIQAIVWFLILFSGMVYLVKPTEQAFVLRSGEIIRVSDGGLHMKVPFMDEAIIYPTHTIFKYRGEPT